MLAKQTVVRTIEWPSYDVWLLQREMAAKPPEEFLAKAVGLIDNGDGDALRIARQILERLLQRNSKFEPAYVELARLAMQSN